MKKYILILMLFILCSCFSTEKEELYIHYIKQFETIINSKYDNNGYKTLTDLMNNLKVYNKKVEPFWLRANKVKLESDKLYNETEIIKKRILSENVKLSGLKNTTNKIRTKEKNN